MPAGYCHVELLAGLMLMYNLTPTISETFGTFPSSLIIVHRGPLASVSAVKIHYFQVVSLSGGNNCKVLGN